MCAELTKSESSLNFHLDGESQIDAKLLSRIINDFAELTQCAAKDIDHEAYLKMNVTAFENGSFNIAFSAVCEKAGAKSTPVFLFSDFASSHAAPFHQPGGQVSFLFPRM